MTSCADRRRKRSADPPATVVWSVLVRYEADRGWGYVRRSAVGLDDVRTVGAGAHCE
jgi:hypothetical protein